MDYKIEIDDTQVLPAQPEIEPAFKVTYYKEVEDKTGKVVVVPDDAKEEHVSASQLTAQKVRLQAQIKEIDAKLLAISKM